MKTRTDLLNHLAEKYSLQRYLEIGVQVPELNFDKISCKHKVGVDPDTAARATWQMTSDEFFAGYPFIEVTSKDSNGIPEFLTGNLEDEDKFDLCFIDGLHTAEQVKKDFDNALKILSPNGFIVLHDTNPETYERTIVPRPTPTGPWNGDVYKFATTLYMNDFVTVDIDNGVSVFRNRDNGQAIIIDRSWAYTWEIFEEYREEDLNLINWDDFANS